MKSFILFIVFFFIGEFRAFCQLNTGSNEAPKVIFDSISIKEDSLKAKENLRARTYQVILNDLLKQNKYITFSTSPVSFVSTKKQPHGKEYLFYLLSGILLVFGFFKVFYVKYFNNIFRVFFNTSLRQNQLTDLLLQARLPSLIFNIFFTITGGMYLWLILQHFQLIQYHNKIDLLFCIISIGLIYFIKFLVLKFIGWATGLTAAFDTYIFVIFLINKIVGIILIPFIIILAFSSPEWLDSMVILSLLMLGIFFLLRFFRSYNLLQQQLDIKRLHFFLYISSIEILPLFLIFKTLLKLSFFIAG